MNPIPEETPATLAEVPPVLPMTQPVAPARPTAAAIRLWSIFAFLTGLAILGLGAVMTPNPSGIGTHAACLHLPPCGMYTITGVPCPTCGCTTAVTWFAHARPDKAFLTQPFGALVALAALVSMILGGIGLVSGRWVGPDLEAIAWKWRPWTITLLAYFLAAWAYKIIAIRMHFSIH